MSTELPNSETGTNKELPKDIKSIWAQFKEFVLGLLDIRQDTDHKATIEGIKSDIAFKGHTAWILIFSIFIASIGLNNNSTAVVIGAMLISPLMGPILGIGLSVGINDIETLRRSLVNFGVMVFLSVLTAFIYFTLTPLQAANSEILGRTEPTVLDVLIALFGGLALIVAKSKRGTMAGVIFGVAIATALMPPLCTAGFGLATGNMEYFLKALYLFCINTVFIALSTFVVVKYLRFPMARYANSARRKRVNIVVSAVALLMIIPSVFSFLGIMNKTFYENEATEFLNKVVIYPGSEKIRQNIKYDDQVLEVFMIGNNVPEFKKAEWQAKLSENKRLAGTELEIRQGQDRTDELTSSLSSKVKEGVLQDLYAQNSKALSDKDAKIKILENEIQHLAEKLKKEEVPLVAIAKEAKINYEGIAELSFAKEIHTDLKTLDTLPLAVVKWGEKTKKKEVEAQSEKLRKWLQFKMKLDTLVIENKY